MTFEGGVPAEHEVYFSITDDTRFRAPTITLTHRGGVDIEELDKTEVATVPFDALTGLKAFVIANALTDIGAPREIISPLVQHLPKLWELFHHYGMTTLELNPIRMRPTASGRLTPVACDFKCGFDRDDPRVARLEPAGAPVRRRLLGAFEQEVNELRTHQGQSDVFVINEKGTILAPTFGGGANSLVTEVLGDAASISSDFGGNPPYEKMKDVARICYRHFLAQSNVLFIIGGKSNNTDIHETLRAMGDALREHFSTHGPTPLYVVVGRGGPNLVRGFGALRDTCEALGLPYRFFGFDSAMCEVVNYAQEDRRLDEGRRARRDRAPARPSRSGRLKETRSCMHHGLPAFPYFVGIGSLADVATRGDRVCVLNILGGESRAGHADEPRLLRRQRRLRHLAGARRPGAEDRRSATSRCSTACARGWMPATRSTPASSTCRLPACATASPS